MGRRDFWQDEQVLMRDISAVTLCHSYFSAASPSYAMRQLLSMSTILF